jgi:hypothetical protein
MSLVLNVEILGEFKNLTAATKGAQSQLTAMNKKAANVSKAITGAFAAIGVGFSLRIITQELEEAAKAAIEDTKSQKLLALAMENTANATKDQIAQAEKSINKMQFQAGVADDQLRPAFQKLFIATKDVTQSNRLLQIALDASAATGKSLDAVSQAMAKSLAGSDTALVKLIPSLKGAKDPMAELEKTFKGAATEAANIDPYQKMQVIFGELQEQIGMALLPTLNKFSAWLSTPEGTAKMQAIIDLAIGMIDKFTILTDWVLKNKDAIIAFSGVLAVAAVGFKAVTTAITVYNTVMAASAIATGALTASLGPLAVALGTVLTLWTAYSNIQAGGGVLSPVPSGSPGSTFLGSTGSSNSGNMGFNVPKAAPKAAAKTNVVVNVKATQSPQQIATAINKGSFYSGTQLLRGGR